jgi:hypothetical protein
VGNLSFRRHFCTGAEFSQGRVQREEFNVQGSALLVSGLLVSSFWFLFLIYVFRRYVVIYR